LQTGEIDEPVEPDEFDCVSELLAVARQYLFPRRQVLESGFTVAAREGHQGRCVFRTVNDQPTLWDAILPCELLVLPAELARVDALLDDPVFFAPFMCYFDPVIGRPSIPMETYLRMMFLKFR
jgi:hypothetical protein